ncbi:14143_t:CDS:2, partial [Acaulospora colombiana]
MAPFIRNSRNRGLAHSGRRDGLNSNDDSIIESKGIFDFDGTSYSLTMDTVDEGITLIATRNCRDQQDEASCHYPFDGLLAQSSSRNLYVGLRHSAGAVGSSADRVARPSGLA